jgi:hypothetical protein
MDGMGLAGAFNKSASLSLTTTLCICLHELPQELSDFTVLLNSGFSVKRALIFNFLSGVVAVIGCFVGLMLNQQNSLLLTSEFNEKSMEKQKDASTPMRNFDSANKPKKHADIAPNSSQKETISRKYAT